MSDTITGSVSTKNVGASRIKGDLFGKKYGKKRKKKTRTGKR